MKDIEYIKNRNKQRKINEMNIALESIFLNIEMHFKERGLFEKQLYIHIPEEFIKMSEISQKIKYPSENRPEIILTSADSTVNFTFSLLPLKNQTTSIFDTITAIKAVVKRKNPANLFYHLKVIKSTDGNEIGYCDYLGYALDGDIYNVMYVMIVNKKLLLGTFCCPKGSMEQWKVIIPQILKTICTEKNGGEENGR